MTTFAEQSLPDTTDRATTEEAKITSWRFEQFQELGFDNEDALLLALSKTDLQSARTLMAAGCSVGLAMRILL
jgi:hypothetical protein